MQSFAVIFSQNFHASAFLRKSTEVQLAARTLRTSPNGICRHLWYLHRLHKLEVNTVTYCARNGKTFSDWLVALSLVWLKLRATPLLDPEKCL